MYFVFFLNLHSKPKRSFCQTLYQYSSLSQANCWTQPFCKVCKTQVSYFLVWLFCFMAYQINPYGLSNAKSCFFFFGGGGGGGGVCVCVYIYTLPHGEFSAAVHIMQRIEHSGSR